MKRLQRHCFLGTVVRLAACSDLEAAARARRSWSTSSKSTRPGVRKQTCTRTHANSAARRSREGLEREMRQRTRCERNAAGARSARAPRAEQLRL
eukprot:6192404-Pleurochrysis_carterae.AAC.1